MSNEKIIMIIVVILIVLNILLGYGYYKEKNKNPVTDTVMVYPDSTRLFIQKEKILNRIDTVYIKIETLSEAYEKVYNIIASESTDSDRIFFTRYIAGYDSAQAGQRSID